MTEPLDLEGDPLARGWPLHGLDRAVDLLLLCPRGAGRGVAPDLRGVRVRNLVEELLRMETLDGYDERHRGEGGVPGR